MATLKSCETSDLLEGVHGEVELGPLPLPGGLTQLLSQEAANTAHVHQAQRLHTDCGDSGVTVSAGLDNV